METKGTIFDLFQTAVHAETEAYAFYLKLSYAFSHVAEAARFWKGMMADEIQHSRDLSQMMSLLPRDELDAPADPEMLEKARRVLSLLKGAAAEHVESLDEAYFLAAKIESSEVNDVFRFLIGKYLASESAKATVSEMERHREKIRAFAGTFGDSEKRKAVKARSAYAWDWSEED
jgi:rubrerythrin